MVVEVVEAAAGLLEVTVLVQALAVKIPGRMVRWNSPWKEALEATAARDEPGPPDNDSNRN